MSPTPEQTGPASHNGPEQAGPSKFAPRPSRIGVAPEPNLTPEMIREREDAHLKFDERRNAAMESQAMPAQAMITDEILKTLVAARGWTLLTEEVHGGAMATLEAKVTDLVTRNEGLVKSSAELQQRAQMAEASAAASIKELASVKDARSEAEKIALR